MFIISRFISAADYVPKFAPAVQFTHSSNESSSSSDNEDSVGSMSNSVYSYLKPGEMTESEKSYFDGHHNHFDVQSGAFCSPLLGP